MDKLKDLNEQGRMIRERIIQIEQELREPMEQDPEDSAAQEGTREVLVRLHRIEMANLQKIESDIRELV